VAARRVSTAAERTTAPLTRVTVSIEGGGGGAHRGRKGASCPPPSLSARAGNGGGYGGGRLDTTARGNRDSICFQLAQDRGLAAASTVLFSAVEATAPALCSGWLSLCRRPLRLPGWYAALPTTQIVIHDYHHCAPRRTRLSADRQRLSIAIRGDRPCHALFLMYTATEVHWSPLATAPPRGALQSSSRPPESPSKRVLDGPWMGTDGPKFAHLSVETNGGVEAVCFLFLSLSPPWPLHHCISIYRQRRGRPSGPRPRLCPPVAQAGPKRPHPTARPARPRLHAAPPRAPSCVCVPTYRHSGGSRHAAPPPRPPVLRLPRNPPSTVVSTGPIWARPQAISQPWVNCSARLGYRNLLSQHHPHSSPSAMGCGWGSGWAFPGDGVVPSPGREFFESRWPARETA